MNAKLKIKFERLAVVGIEYILNTVIDTTSGITTPTELNNALVIIKGDENALERIDAIATYEQLVTTPLPALPTSINLFKSDGFLSFTPQVGDIIRVTTPNTWRQVYGSSITEDYTITDAATAFNTVTVTPEFPAFGNNLNYEIYRAASLQFTGTTGVSNRDYTGLTGSYFLTSNHADTFESPTNANDMQTILESQAQAVVDAFNVDNYSGTTIEVFE